MTARYTMVVPFGDDVASLDRAIMELPTGRVIAIIPPNSDSKVTDRVKTFLSSKGIEFETRKVEGESSDSFFLELSRTKAEHGDGSLVVNVSVGTPLYSHILLCAAMATGVTALGVYEGKVTFLPISCSITHGG